MFFLGTVSLPHRSHKILTSRHHETPLSLFGVSCPGTRQPILRLQNQDDQNEKKNGSITTTMLVFALSSTQPDHPDYSFVTRREMISISRTQRNILKYSIYSISI